MAESFGPLLKSWRSQRRMSQLELGLAANVSARHISFLETGRAQPSRSMVLQLSETLDVPRAIRNVLLTAAGFARAYVARSLDADDMADIRAAMEWMLERHNPFPAIALDKHWHLVRANASATALLGSMDLKEGDSLLEALMQHGPFAAALENRDEVAHHLVSRLRTESAHLGGDEILDAAAAGIAATLDKELQVDQTTLPAIIPARYNANGMMLSFFSTIAQFGSTEDIALADLKIELMFPADEATREALVNQFG